MRALFRIPGKWASKSGLSAIAEHPVIDEASQLCVCVGGVINNKAVSRGEENGTED